MNRSFVIALLGTTALAPLAGAQSRGAGAGRGFRGSFAQNPGAARVRSGVLGAPLFYSDYSPETAVVEAPPPQIFVLQPSPAEPAKETMPEPLLIEWQGDRYVRVSDSSQNNARPGNTAPDYAQPANLASAVPLVTKAQPEAAALPPAVLVYRDGHHEAIRDYSIVEGTIYARGNYWSDGYWNKKIQLSALDLPATLKASQDNGVKFVLPSAPNEVITRP